MEDVVHMSSDGSEMKEQHLYKKLAEFEVSRNHLRESWYHCEPSAKRANVWAGTYWLMKLRTPIVCKLRTGWVRMDDMCGDGPLKWSERTYAQGFMTSSQVDGEIVQTIEPPINPRDLGRISWLDVVWEGLGVQSRFCCQVKPRSHIYIKRSRESHVMQFSRNGVGRG